jgi:hypothetical protein
LIWTSIFKFSFWGLLQLTISLINSQTFVIKNLDNRLLENLYYVTSPWSSFFIYGLHCISDEGAVVVVCDRMVVGFTTTYAISVITIKVLSLNPAYGYMYLIQHCVIKFFSDLRQVCGFLRVLMFPPPIKLTATI